nr:SpoIIE family protein phosphatase [uncultured Carboxylicivirga sp.]
MQNKCFYIESETCQANKYLQNVCGDTCESHKLKDEDRFVSVLADGLGSGVKANVLSTMTSGMVLQFTTRNQPLEHTSEFILRTMPSDSQRHIAYSTFSIVDINCFGEAHFAEYHNPAIIIYRNGSFINLQHAIQKIARPDQIEGIVKNAHLKLEKEDRIIVVSDGITQSGIGSRINPFGWGEEGLKDFVKASVEQKPAISALEMARKILERAKANDLNQLKDDATCQVIYCREPRKLVLASGPPYYKNYDSVLAERVATFEGKKIICGGTTSQIISRELDRKLEVKINVNNLELPPEATMNGIDLITEGILTLGKASSILESIKNNIVEGTGPAEDLVRTLLQCDSILILAGTQINNAHQDPNLPVELEIRRNILKKIASLLETKFLKTVDIEYL